jgi:predicted ATP-dependent serine protease
LIGIYGARGTGKTTLLLQKLADQDTSGKTYLYVSADHVQVQSMGLYNIASITVAFLHVSGVDRLQ